LRHLTNTFKNYHDKSSLGRIKSKNHYLLFSNFVIKKLAHSDVVQKKLGACSHVLRVPCGRLQIYFLYPYQQNF